MGVILVFVTGPVGVAASIWCGACRVMAGRGVGDGDRRLFALPRGDDNGWPLGVGVHGRAPSATVFPDAGTSGDRVLPDGVCGGGHRNVWASPVVGAMAVMVMRLVGRSRFVSRGGHDMYVAAVEGAVTATHGGH